MFKQFNEAGFLVIPEKNGVPLKGVEWSKYNLSNVPEFKEINGNGYGLICGEVSNVIGIDIDDDESVPMIEGFLGSPSVIKKGGKGYTAFFRYNGEKSKVWKKNGKVICELLSNGRKTTIPPSPYKQTNEVYKYLKGDLLESQLNDIPTNFIQVMDAIFPQPKRKIEFKSVDIMEDVDFSDAEEMLKFLDADCSRDEWIQIGMALRSKFGDAAFNIWDNWSSKGSKYKQNESWRTWRSFDGTGVTIGTLVYFAKQAGYIKCSKVIKEGIENPFLERKRREKDFKAPYGLVGDFYNFILETSIMPQPRLALAASLCAVGTLKGHRYATETDLRSNLLVLGLAPSGSGKDHARKVVAKVFSKAGFPELLSGNPASHVGLINALHRDDGVKLIQIDEIGRLLKTIAHKNASTYEKAIMTEIMMLFSSASTTYYGREYADSDKKNPPKNIEEPCLCVYGTTVRNHFEESLVSNDALDGFLSRWLVLETDIIPDDNENYKSLRNVPESLIAQVQAIRSYAELEVVRYDTEARALMKQMRLEDKERVRNADDAGRSIYSRRCEHIAKVALVMSNNEKITKRDVEYAKWLVQGSTAKIFETIKNGIAESDFERKMNKVLKIVQKFKKISRSRLLNNSHLSAKELNEILENLAERGKIEVIKTQSGGLSITLSNLES